jgi:hypothetical protein
MLFKNATRQTQEAKIEPISALTPLATEIAYSDKELSESELRRQMYERIAQGSALNEAEEHARRMWNGR